MANLTFLSFNSFPSSHKSYLSLPQNVNWLFDGVWIVSGA
jgi:hypothetical protein